MEMGLGQSVWTRKGGRREAECTRMRGLYACAECAAGAGARTGDRGTEAQTSETPWLARHGWVLGRDVPYPGRG